MTCRWSLAGGCALVIVEAHIYTELNTFHVVNVPHSFETTIRFGSRQPFKDIIMFTPHPVDESERGYLDRNFGAHVAWGCCQCRTGEYTNDSMSDDEFRNLTCKNLLVDHKTMKMEMETVGAQPVSGLKTRLSAKLKQFLGVNTQPPLHYMRP